MIKRIYPTFAEGIKTNKNCLIFFKDGNEVGRQEYPPSARLHKRLFPDIDADVIFRFGRINTERGVGVYFKVYAKSSNNDWVQKQHHTATDEHFDFKSLYIRSLTAKKTKVKPVRLPPKSEPSGGQAAGLAPTVRFNKENKIDWGVYVAIFRDGQGKYRSEIYFTGYKSPQNVWANYSKKAELTTAFAGISVRLEGLVDEQAYLRYTIKVFEPALKFVRYDGRCKMTLTIDEAKPWDSATEVSASMLGVFSDWMELKNKDFK